jgi:hypothetical protein
MNKQEQIQQQINQLFQSKIGKVPDGTLKMMSNAKSKAKIYYIYNANGEFVQECLGRNEVTKLCKIKPEQKSLKWIIKQEYLGEKI